MKPGFGSAKPEFCIITLVVGFFCKIIEKKDTSYMVLLGDNTKVEVVSSVIVKKIEA